MYPDPTAVIFSRPPVRKSRAHKPQDHLDTITERPGPQVNQQLDPSTSTMDMPEGDRNSPKKVQKAQITTLAKMLSALRR